MEFFIREENSAYHSKTKTKDSRSINRFRVFIFFHPQIIFPFLFSQNFHEISTEKATTKRENRSNSGDPSTPVDCARRGSENGILFFIAQKKPFHRKNPFFGSAHVPKLGASNVSQPEWKKGKDGSVTKRVPDKRVPNARASRRRIQHDDPPPFLHRFLASTTSPPPVKSPPFSLLSDSLTLLPTSRLLSKELSSPETRVSPPFAKAQSFTTSPTTFALAFCVCTHDAPLPLVHTSVPRKMSICRANDSLAQYYAIETPDFLCSSRHGLLISIPCTGTNFRPFVRNVCIFEGCALVRSCCFEIYFLAYISFQEFSFLIIIYIFRYIYFILDGKDILSRKKIAWLWSFVFLFIHMYHVYNTLLSWFKSNTNVL